MDLLKVANNSHRDVHGVSETGKYKGKTETSWKIKTRSIEKNTWWNKELKSLHDKL